LKNLENINIGSSPKTVLIAPLDWGLGHATRCIPIISFLLSQKITVIIAAEGATALILKEAFPNCLMLPLRGYRIRYSSSGKWFSLKLATQLPKIFFAARYEKKWLKQIVKQYQINGIISDNRLGLSHKHLPSVFITHQLQIQTGQRWLDRFVQRINYSYINQFNSCWVPDLETQNNYAGLLSHPTKMPNIPVHYLGVLSRLEFKESDIKYRVCFLLSGPEPQRTILETALMAQLKNLDGPLLMVRGLPNEKELPSSSHAQLTIYNHQNSTMLNELISQSELVVCRSGYSSVMDLIACHKKAILIPTPGQTEQIYLAKHLEEKGLFVSALQSNVNLPDLIRKALAMQLPKRNQLNWNRSIVNDWIKSI
jgi:UDP-N-acetylglucosamine transferase subunit ALG13